MGWADNKYVLCAHCGVEFLGTLRQLKRVKYESADVYCSPICRQAGFSKKTRKPIPTFGPCPTCGQFFQSRQRKKYCSIKCYTSSAQFKQMMKENRRKSAETRARNPRPKKLDRIECLECGVVFYASPWKKQKFCSFIHYREYMAKRFDRWMANPETIALPQGYDEFLTQEELPCLVEGCDWRGKLLSGHMNYAHGVPAHEFKRAAGFNLGTGVVCKPTHEILCNRPFHLSQFVGSQSEVLGKLSRERHYMSLEGREHGTKGRALACGVSKGPQRICVHCGSKFWQSTPFGYTKYCSFRCRDLFYYRISSKKKFVICCSNCGTSFKGTKHQLRRFDENLPVMCSIVCRQRASGRASGRARQKS